MRASPDAERTAQQGPGTSERRGTGALPFDGASGQTPATDWIHER